MSAPLYALVKAFTGFCVRRFYRIEVLGGPLPADGPLLVVANHPNGLIDPLLLAEAGARPLRMLGKEPLLRLPVVGSFARAFGMLPVYRQQDGADTQANQRTFAAVHAALASAQAVSLFPEGKSHSAPGLERLKTGAARMALGAEAQAHFALDLAIVPIGLVYRDKAAFQSSVAVCIGKALHPARDPDWVRLAKSDEWAAVEVLNQRIAQALERVTLGLERWEDLPLLELAERVWRPASTAGPRIESRVRRLRALARGLRELRARDPSTAQALTLQAERLHANLERSGLSTRALARRPGGGEILNWSLRQSLTLVAGALPALAGFAAWLVPYQLVRLCLLCAPQELDIRATAKLLASMLWFSLTLAAWCLLAFQLLGLLGALACAVLLPLLGMFSLSYWRGRLRAFASVQSFVRQLGRSRLRASIEAQASELAARIEALAQRTRQF